MIKKKKQSSAHLKKEDKRPEISPENVEYDNLDFLIDDYIDPSLYEENYAENEYENPEPVFESEPIPEEKPEKPKREKPHKEKKEKPVRVPKEKIKKEKPPKNKKAKKEKASAAEKPEKKSRFRKLKISLICILCVLVLAFAGIAAGGYYVTKSPEILPKVYVDGIFVGGMLPEDVPELLEKNGWDEKTAEAFRVKLPAGVSFKLDKCAAGAVFTKDSAQRAAYMYGHAGNIFENLFAYLMNYISPVDVSREYLRINRDYIRDTAEKGIEKFNDKTADRGFVIDNKNEVLRMVKGAGQMKIDAGKLCAEIENALIAGKKELVYNHIDSSLKAPDFDAMHSDLSVEPQDAYYNDDFSVNDEVVGCDFDVENAKAVWEEAAPAELVEIPLSISMPEKTGEYLRSLIYRDKLGSMTSSYKGSIEARVNNINLASDKIDGLVLMPGDVFSYNGTVGQRTREAGFQAAAAYADGEVVEEVGGGICQVSSTLYAASMYANLETVNRVNHYFKVGYMDWGMDATVSWPKPDFKFKNNRDYPVQIRSYCDNDNETITIEIWGTNLDGSYVKEITHGRLAVYDEEYPGEVVIGYGVTSFRQVYDADDNFLYEVKEPYGVYYKHKEDIVYPDPPAEGEGFTEAEIVTE